MIYSVNFMELTEKINPLAVAQYLRNTNWEEFETKRDYVKIFQHITDAGEFYQVQIPMEKELADYKTAMFDSIAQIALVEGQSTERLMLYLLNPNTDILKIRLQKNDIEGGSLLFDDAISLYGNAKKLIAAAAQDVLRPQKYHQGRQDDTVASFVNNCKFGQTEIGSYVISVVCPFAELDESEEYKQLSIFSDEEECANSLTRRVTNRIMQNVSTIKKNIDRGKLETLVSDDENPLISANFYEALAGMDLETEDTTIEFSAQWSPVVKINRYQESKIALSHDYYQPIITTIEKLRGSISTHQRILGRVKKLESTPDANKRESGKVTMVYLDEDEKKKTVRVLLNKDDYNRAIEAHEAGRHVEVIGDIENGSGRTRSMTCESFSVIG
ncbi:MAG: hypothetical protein K6E30_00835 [Lachnospiraceae bacterium]|nr:hypothetical protein [Lachnospiraceae bacterium]